MTDSPQDQRIRDPSLSDALIPLIALALLIGSAIALFGVDALDGPVQVALVLCCAVAALVALKNGHQWSQVQEAGQGAQSSITSALFILLAVGALIGTWNLSGTIPTLVYYGIQVLSPGYFYVATAVICGIVALSIGSSWTTAGTVGVGLIGIATMIGVSPAIAAGAVISGAYLGDKLSPLSETTILTAQMVKVDLYTHIRSQAWTSVPAFVIAAAAFAVLGVVGPPVRDTVSEEVELTRLNEIFSINVLNLLPLAAALTSLLLVALLFAADALDFMLDLTAALSLIPYLLAAAYALKLTATRETYGEGKSVAPDMLVAGIATVYTLFLLYAAGMDKLLLSCILYAPAAALYFKARRERGLRVFHPAEATLFGVIVIGAVVGVVSLATGTLQI
jgi:Na+/H+ antiporter NhaC